MAKWNAQHTCVQYQSVTRRSRLRVSAVQYVQVEPPAVQTLAWQEVLKCSELQSAANCYVYSLLCKVERCCTARCFVIIQECIHV